MGQTCILTGMILNTMPVGEYDKRITILTRERGKITAFARGARRPKSSLQAATNLFCFGTFEAYEGRSSYTVVKAEISNYFRELAMDLDKTYYGCYFLELADYFCQENNDCINQLKLVYQTLRALNVPSLSPKLVRVIYELKTLVYFGVYPNVFACTSCGSREQLWCFDEKSNGVMCRECQPGSREISAGLSSVIYDAVHSDSTGGKVVHLYCYGGSSWTGNKADSVLYETVCGKRIEDPCFFILGILAIRGVNRYNLEIDVK